jgi:ribosomal protein S9
LRRAGGTSAQVLLKVRTLGGGVMRMAIGALRHLIGRALGDLRHDARGLRAHHRGRGMIAAAFGHHFEEYSRENQESL